jgi:UDP-hydrolysing UDP-N-acetyl-D-glucosamine 2-epimerase
MPLATLRDDPAFEVRLIVTGQHLAKGEETSLEAIAAEGFAIDEHVNIAISDDSTTGVSNSLGLAVSGIAAALARHEPDLLLVLGDRYEILAAAAAALIARVPVAHLCGGDITEGAFDDAIRHAITKLSHLHFVTNTDAHTRVIQLGEDPAHVHLVGSPGLDRIRTTPATSADEFFADVGLPQRASTLLVTYHPPTLADDPLAECREMLAALDSLGPNVSLLCTGSNADPGARGIDGLIGTFVLTHQNAVAVRTLGPRRYLSALAHVDAVVGNSSSGLYEAPSFHIPTVNIGDRQKGRLRAASVIDCPGERTAIRAAIDTALARDCTGVVNPYGDGHASERIVAVLKALDEPRSLVRKRFFDIAVGQAA